MSFKINNNGFVYTEKIEIPFDVSLDDLGLRKYNDYSKTVKHKEYLTTFNATLWKCKDESFIIIGAHEIHKGRFYKGQPSKELAERFEHWKQYINQVKETKQKQLVDELNEAYLDSVKTHKQNEFRNKVQTDYKPDNIVSDALTDDIKELEQKRQAIKDEIAEVKKKLKPIEDELSKEYNKLLSQFAKESEHYNESVDEIIVKNVNRYFSNMPWY